MKCHPVLLSCVLLVMWTLAESQNYDVKVEKTSDGIDLSCEGENFNKLKKGDATFSDKKVKLLYNDSSSGEYTCDYNSTDGPAIKSKIYVKFRTCDNCIEIDISSILSLVVGDLVATVVIGASVYLIVSNARPARPTTSQPKSSDRQRLVPNEASAGSSNDHYQKLRYKGGKDTYDVIQNRK